MTETIQNLIPVIALTISFIALYLNFTKEDNSSYFVNNIDFLKKEIAKKDKSIRELNETIKKQEDFFRSTKYTLQNKNENLEKKVAELFDRFFIISHDSITSIPQTNKEWFEAKQIVNQPKLKEWKPKNLSQSKSSIINQVNTYLDNEEERNQDFSEFSDEDFENIIDEDDEDSSSSSATDNTQNKKPKSKKNKSKEMKSSN